MKRDWEKKRERAIVRIYICWHVCMYRESKDRGGGKERDGEGEQEQEQEQDRVRKLDREHQRVGDKECAQKIRDPQR